MLNITQALLKAGRPGLMMMVVEISCRPQPTDTLTHPEPGLAEKTRREITTETGHSQVRGSNAEYGLSPPSTTQGNSRETQKQLKKNICRIFFNVCDKINKTNDFVLYLI